MRMHGIEKVFECRTCVARGSVGKPLVGLNSEALVVWCKRCDQLVGAFTPRALAEMLEHPPECECCRAQRGPAS